MIATLSGNLDMVRLLVKNYKFNVNSRENDGYTPLMAACANGYIDIIKFYINDTNANENAKNFEGQTALVI